jgi:hypothetical protein
MVFGGEQVLDQATDPRPGSAGLLEESIELGLGDVVLVEGNVELALDFSAGALSVAEKADELNVAAAVKAFGDVVHDRAGCALNLVAQAEVLRKARSTRALVHVSC